MCTRLTLVSFPVMASGKGYTDIVATLIAASADVHLGRSDGSTPLFMASQEGRTEIVNMLLVEPHHPAQWIHGTLISAV